MPPDLRWLGPDENDWGVPVLDCRALAWTVVSTTGDPQVAQRFGASRTSDGREVRGLRLPSADAGACSLRYPPLRVWHDGPLFRAPTMEDKWDCLLFDDVLTITRSWTGDVGYQCHASGPIEPDQEWAIDRVLVARREPEIAVDLSYAVREVDFIVKAHLLGRLVPHPIPPGLTNDAEQIAVASFSLHGRRGCFATFADTLPL